MSRISITLTILIFLTSATTAFAMDFTVQDFDPAPDDDAVSLDFGGQTRDAVMDLMIELTVVKSDSAGNEILRVMPLPMELVGLMTQADIFETLARSEEEIAPLVENANANKPGPNYFGFIIDGDAEWVNRVVSVWYIPETGGIEGILIPVYLIKPGEPDSDGRAVSEWILVAETADELHAFLNASSVKLIIEDEDPSINPIILDIGFWRMYGLFDLRTTDINDASGENAAGSGTQQ